MVVIEPLLVGLSVKLREGGRVVAGLLEDFRQSLNFGIESLAVFVDSVDRGVQGGQDGSVGRCRVRRLRVVVQEEGAFCRESVEIRRRISVVACGTDMIGT